jgi:hypothetical protein
MTEKSMFWGGTTIGDHGPYGADDFAEFMRALFCLNPATQGFLRTPTGAQFFPSVSGLEISIDSGRALVYGTLYELYPFTYLTIVDPGALRYYRVVLRKSWATKDVVLTMLGPTTPGFPPLVQTPGVTWDLSIARLTVPSGGPIQVTNDDRLACAMPSWRGY